jgi:MYXO-CTERM domain-containing protein
MKRWILGIVLGIGAAPAAVLAQTCIRFQQTDEALEDLAMSCGRFVDPLDPGPRETYAIQFALARDEATQARVYYTTDGSAPAGSLGNAIESSRVVAAERSCSFSSDPVQDVFKASIPAAEPGTTIRFIVSAWKEGGAESFLAMPVDGGSECSAATSSQAQVFQYDVTEASPRPVPDVIMVAMDTPRVIPASVLMANDRFVTADTRVERVSGEWRGELSREPDGSLVYTPPPGFYGEEWFPYVLTIPSSEGTSDSARVRLIIKPPTALVSVADEPSGAHCPAGGKRIDVGIDDGAGGTTPFDGKLDAPEVTGTSYACNGAPGAQGSAGGAAGVALVRTSSEPAGANCSRGGQKVEAGVDADGNGALEDAEVTSAGFVCTGATGKSGCSASPGELSGLLALGSLAWFGLRRRRFEEECRR